MSFRPIQAPFPIADVLVRQAVANDAARLADWLDAGAPLPELARRHRRAMLDTMLSRPEAGPCVLAEQGGVPQGLLTVQLAPRLDLAGLAAVVGEWWCLRGAHESGAMLTLCCDWLADWCRAHGVRHLLVSAEVAGQAEALTAATRPAACGLRHRDLAPAVKQLS